MWTREKTADGRHGRNMTRAMENWAKPRTRHTDVHGPLHGPVNGLYVDTGKNGRRPSWTKRDARHGKLGKTTYEAHGRTRALTRTLERAVRGHVKKTAEARRGRNVTRAMENWAKPRTRHTDVHGPLHGPVNGLYVDTGKNGRTPAWTKRDARHGKLGKTTYEAHGRTRTLTRTRERAVRGHVKKTADARRGRNVTRAMENWSKPCTTHTPLHGPVNGLYVDTGKNGRRPSWTERDARHGKLVKTMYDAHARTRTRERAVRGHGKKRPTPVVDGTGRAPWKTGQNHVRGTHTYTDP